MTSAVATAPLVRSGGTVRGTWLVVRLAVRRNRWFWSVWVLALWATVAATRTSYDRLAEPGGDIRTTMAELAANPTMRAMLGPPFDLTSVGGYTMFRVGTFVAAAAAMMAALGVIRTTRGDEEVGRLELLRAGTLGRHAPLLGGVLVALGGCGLLALLVVASQSLAAPPLAGALGTGLGIGLVAAVWVGVGAVAAQLSASARAARGIALGSLGAAYLLRAVADAAPEGSARRGLGWLSPLDWAALSRPYSGERWWVLLVPVVVTALLLVMAFRLESRRDHGAGVRAATPGRAHASATLSSASGLAVRLERGGIAAWTLGTALFAYTAGTLTAAFDQMLRDNPDTAGLLQQIGRGAGDLRSAFYVAALGIVIVVLAAGGLQVVLRLGREEARGRAEIVLSTDSPRVRVLGAYVVLAICMSSALTLLAAALLGSPQALRDGEAVVVWDLIRSAAALLPGVWVVVGLGTMLIGWAPRAAPVAWALVGWSLFVTWIGTLLGLPDRVVDLSPFTALPALPVETMRWTPWLVEALLAVGLVVLGLVGYRRRDIG